MRERVRVRVRVESSESDRQHQCSRALTLPYPASGRGFLMSASPGGRGFSDFGKIATR
jgi:hypothetical protein